MNASGIPAAGITLMSCWPAPAKSWRLTRECTQKVRDIFALSPDYKIREQETVLFFEEVQNKLLYAVTGHTAAELDLD
jgi:hypothetical protein